MKFEISDFDLEELYEENNDGNIRRKIKFTAKTSSPQAIGQSINFPSSWCVNIKCVTDELPTHARFALRFQSFLNDGALARAGSSSNAVVKFRINIIDKDGDLVFQRPWRSWQTPVMINLGKDHGMPDYIDLDELFDSRDLLMPNNTLRLLCEGVLYSSFIQTPVNVWRHSSMPMTPNGDLLESGRYHDVYLACEPGKTFKAHKLILSNASKVLENLLSTVKTDAVEVPTLHLDELTESEISTMLDYVYTGCIKMDWKDIGQVEKIINLAKNYELRGLRWICYKNLVNQMRLSSFPEIVKLCRVNSAGEDVYAILNQFYMRNQDKLIRTESFETFAREEKEAFLNVVLFSGKHSI